MARGTTLVFKNHQQNGSFRSHQILKKKIPITSSFVIVSCPWFLLFCFVLYHQSWRSTYTQAFKNIVVFGLKNRGRLIHESTYTRENTVLLLLLLLLTITMTTTTTTIMNTKYCYCYNNNYYYCCTTTTTIKFSYFWLRTVTIFLLNLSSCRREIMKASVHKLGQWKWIKTQIII